LGIADGRDIAVCHCPGTTTSPGLAESAIMFMLMLVKRYRYAQAYVAEGRVSRMLTEELEGRILAIIGFGASGRRLAIIA
ncbi:MAG: NAD(P)-dependent oxidoreductase, partial [Candidatus Brocadiia bacterium]|nr:NAD(P)-dependent oxidoreductase [Candidatus Brocadiia bacterium]